MSLLLTVAKFITLVATATGNSLIFLLSPRPFHRLTVALGRAQLRGKLAKNKRTKGDEEGKSKRGDCSTVPKSEKLPMMMIRWWQQRHKNAFNTLARWKWTRSTWARYGIEVLGYMQWCIQDSEIRRGTTEKHWQGLRVITPPPHSTYPPYSAHTKWTCHSTFNYLRSFH